MEIGIQTIRRNQGSMPAGAGPRRGLFLLLLLLALAGCGQETPPTQVVAREEADPPTETATAVPSATPTRTAAARPAARATATPSPPPPPPTASPTATASPLPTQTPSPPPTFAPATPAAPESYRLQPWTPAQAEALSGRLEAYPDTLPAEARGYNDGEYYQAFRPAALVQEEALLRFPQAPAAARWRWGLAYNYARSGNARAATLYAALLQQALEAGASSATELPAWFARHERRLALSAIVTAADQRLFRLAWLTPAGEAASGAYLLLDGEASSPRVYPLAYRDAFDPAYGAGLEAGLADVTGDGREELVAVHAHQPGGSRSFYYTDLIVYDLTTLPPRELPFSTPPNTHLGWSDDDSWQVLGVGETVYLRLRERPAERCEAITLISDYAWTGERLRQARREYEIGPGAGNRYCLPFLFSAAEAGQQEALQLLENNLFSGGPAQADEWRYRLGVYQALTGSGERALAYLDDLVADPRGDDRTWVRAATTFRESYTTGGLYPACQAAEICNTKPALRHLVKTMSPAAFALIPQQLQARGVPVARAGFFDMEGDGRLEQWLLVSSGAQFEFWILVPASHQTQALFVDIIGGSPYAAALERLTPVAGLPLLRLSNGRDNLLFTFTPNGPAVQPLRSRSANESDNYTAQLLAESQARLWQGAPATLVTASLDNFRQSADFDCDAGDLCAEYAYTLGLAQELSGEESAATTTYVALWQAYPDSAYTTIARAKLAPGPSPTATMAP